ncbi:hypothetical protein LMG23994_06345 [Cupriavidus pinatubonensis]|uniref:Uncharacterized protein n=1 Tax=Cupriavidus pinatubonensis TaxID=248026 RepID=A0ABM8Y1T5_9BURK|nr:hypothetical protein LMG23994_06345 [Cupriavidus pinatubonensis]
MPVNFSWQVKLPRFWPLKFPQQCGSDRSRYLGGHPAGGSHSDIDAIYRSASRAFKWVSGPYIQEMSMESINC